MQYIIDVHIQFRKLYFCSPCWSCFYLFHLILQFQQFPRMTIFFFFLPFTSIYQVLSLYYPLPRSRYSTYVQGGQKISHLQIQISNWVWNSIDSNYYWILKKYDRSHLYQTLNKHWCVTTSPPQRNDKISAAKDKWS